MSRAAKLVPDPLLLFAGIGGVLALAVLAVVFVWYAPPKAWVKPCSLESERLDVDAPGVLHVDTPSGPITIEYQELRVFVIKGKDKQ